LEIIFKQKYCCRVNPVCNNKSFQKMFTIVVNYHTITIASAPLTVYEIRTQGRIQGGGAPLKLEKIWIFGVNPWFFTRNTQTFFAPPSVRRNIFKYPPPLSWNPGSAPGTLYVHDRTTVRFFFLFILLVSINTLVCKVDCRLLGGELDITV
jgi:hypothetical protein